MIMKIIKQIIFVLIVTSFCGLGAWYYSSQQTPQYKSSIGLLIIQAQEGIYDPSVASRSAESIATTLSQVIVTEDFIDEVAKTGFDVPERLHSDSLERREYWNSIIVPEARNGFLYVDVYSENPVYAENIAGATSYVLTKQTNKWHGGGESVSVHVVDSPRTSTAPVRPNVPLNTMLGVITGLLLSLALIFYRNYFPVDEYINTTTGNQTGIVPVKVINHYNQVEYFEDVNAILLERAEKIFIDGLDLDNSSSSDSRSELKYEYDVEKSSKNLESRYIKSTITERLATVDNLYI